METGFVVPDSVSSAYDLEGARIDMLRGGRTNRTMRARAGRDLVLQQMRCETHDDLLGVMENLVRVTGHLDWKRRVEDGGESWYPELVPTITGKPFMMNEEGDVWRAFRYRPGQIGRAALPHATTASIARLYGRFAAETSDLGGPPLIDSEPGLHDLDLVHDQLMSDLEASTTERRRGVDEHLELITRLRGELDRRSADDGLSEVPERVVHNDTKISNVVIDHEGGEAIAVLDLDLAMMGRCWHDVGDLIRSASGHQPNVADSAFSVEQFGSLLRGYMEGSAGTMSDEEIATSAVAGPRLSFELGLRYLNDHLRDEPHLRVEGPNGHLRRGVANLNLAEEMFGAYDALRQIVDANIAIRTAEPKGIE